MRFNKKNSDRLPQRELPNMFFSVFSEFIFKETCMGVNRHTLQFCLLLNWNDQCFWYMLLLKSKCTNLLKAGTEAKVFLLDILSSVCFLAILYAHYTGMATGKTVCSMLGIACWETERVVPHHVCLVVDGQCTAVGGSIAAILSSSSFKLAHCCSRQSKK